MSDGHAESESATYRLQADVNVPPREGTISAGTLVVEEPDGWSLGPYLKRVAAEGRSFIVDVRHLTPADGQRTLAEVEHV